MAEDSRGGFFGPVGILRRALERLRDRIGRQGQDLDAERRRRREAEAAAARLKAERDRLEREVRRLAEKAEKLEHDNEELRRLLAAAEHSLETEASDSIGSGTAAKDKRRDPYEPPFAREKSKRKKFWKKPGRKPGHVGARRPIPDQIDHTKVSLLQVCPFCNGDPGQPYDFARYYVEELIPARPDVTLFKEGLYRTACCGREARAPRHPERLFDSTVSLGPQALLHAVYMRMGLGLSFRKMTDAFARLCGMKVTPGGFAQALQRCGRYFEAVYESLIKEARKAGHLHIDETGWRVAARRAWLWIFTGDKLALFSIEASRGGLVLHRFLGDHFNGVIIADFFAAYGTISGEKQRCLVHLFRDLSEMETQWPRSREVARFSTGLFSIIQKGIRLKARREKLTEKTFENKLIDIQNELDEFAATRYRNEDCERLAARIWKHREEILTFVRHASVEYHNNKAERGLRPSVLIRKITGGNWTWKGARAHEILMSVVQTCHLRGIDFLEYGREVIKKYIQKHLKGHKLRKGQTATEATA